MAKKPIPQSPSKKTNPVIPVRNSGKPATVASKADTSWRMWALAVLLMTALFYFPSISNGLVNWDDEPNITDNPNLTMVEKEGLFSTFRDIFSIEKGHVMGGYNPLTIFSFAIEKVMAGSFNTTLIHSTNLLLHLLTVLFAMRVLLALGFNKWGAAFGAMLFGLHPMRVESVAWATERKDVLFGVFFFAALYYYIKWVKSGDTQRKTGLYIAALALAVLSCLSKVQGVTLTLSLLAADYFLRRPLKMSLIWEKIPFFAVSLLFGIINFLTLRKHGTIEDDVTDFTFLDRLCIGAYSFCVYVYKVFIPYPMSPLYPYPKPLPVWVYVAPVGFLAAVAFTVWAWRKDWRIWVFGILFFFFNVMFLLQVLGAGQGFLADRFTYVPYFGLFAIAAWYFGQKAENASARTGLLAGAGVLTLLYGFYTYKQIGIWKNGETLWTHVMKYEEDKNSLPYWNRGQYRRNVLGNYDAALKDYTRAVEIEPKNPELYNSRGKTFFDMAMSGKFNPELTAEYREKAISDYNMALSLPKLKEKSKGEILINRGAAYGSKRLFQEALQSINEGLVVQPDNKNGYFNRSIIYYNLGQYDNALNDYRTYLKYDPYNANIWYESGLILRNKQQYAEALDAHNRALRINPNFGLAYLERARVKALSGDKAGAQKDYQRAQELGQKMDVYDNQIMAQ
jgi:tetratricopeptide (TPR) repeat protein